MAGVMVDTQVLMHACHQKIAAATTGLLRKKIEKKKREIPQDLEDSAWLIKVTTTVHCSSLSIVEFSRIADPLELQWLDELGPKLDVLPVDRPVAEAAAVLLRELRRIPKKNLCLACLNSLNTHPCEMCEKHISEYHRFADAVIAATAQESDKVGTLYCYDGGILNGLAEHLRDCKVSKPPPAPPPPAPPPPQKLPTDGAKTEQIEMFGKGSPVGSAVASSES